jgi:hypothetical protein
LDLFISSGHSRLSMAPSPRRSAQRVRRERILFCVSQLELELMLVSLKTIALHTIDRSMLWITLRREFGPVKSNFATFGQIAIGVLPGVLVLSEWQDICLIRPVSVIPPHCVSSVRFHLVRLISSDPSRPGHLSCRCHSLSFILIRLILSHCVSCV